MKKIIFDPNLLRSSQPMAEALYRLQSQAEDSLHLGQFWRGQEPAPSMPGAVQYEMRMDGLLRPPAIRRVVMEDTQGQKFPILFISTAEDNGAIRLWVSIRDEQGRALQHTGPIYIPRSGSEWGCILLETLPSGTAIHVSVRAMDCVGGVRVEHHRMIIP